MLIAGLQKMTLLDYPGKVACTVFLQGCDLRCPFCHNSPLLPPTGERGMEAEELLAFLSKRRGLLDAVCVSGGEPTLHPELGALLEGIRALGFLIKLDTNGRRPAAVKELAARGLLDYVAMDIKNTPSRYAATCGLPAMDLAPVEQTAAFLMGGTLPYEFRTTVVQELHTAQDIQDMGVWLNSLCPGTKPAAWFLQRFADRESVLVSGLHPCTDAEMQAFLTAAAPYAHRVALRG